MCTCILWVVTDLNQLLVPIAPSLFVFPIHHPVGSSPKIFVEELEPEDSYRIPRCLLSPKIEPEVHRFFERKAAFLAKMVAKQDLRKKWEFPRSKGLFSVCGIICNRSKTFSDHIKSRSYRAACETKPAPRAGSLVGVHLNFMVIFLSRKRCCTFRNSRKTILVAQLSFMSK